MSSPDKLQHFLFSDADIRGQLVGLEESYQQVLENHEYPEPIAKLIGEFLAAASLMSGTIKVNGTLSIQAQGKGDLSLIMAECRNSETKEDQKVRAIARYQEGVSGSSIQELLAGGQLVITIDPDEGKRYQGIVPLEGDTLASCLEAYFEKSEQLKTRIWLATTPGSSVSGLLLQAMPGTGIAMDQDAWPRVCLLTDTLSDSELLETENASLIYRLYHEEGVNLYPPSNVKFKCNCSWKRTASALVSLGQEEIEELLADGADLEVKCEFCNKAYLFSSDALEPYLMEQDAAKAAGNLPPSKTLH